MDPRIGEEMKASYITVDYYLESWMTTCALWPLKKFSADNKRNLAL